MLVVGFRGTEMNKDSSILLKNVKSINLKSGRSSGRLLLF